MGSRNWGFMSKIGVIGAFVYGSDMLLFNLSLYKSSNRYLARSLYQLKRVAIKKSEIAQFQMWNNQQGHK